jgi:hypothetical protein
MSLSLVEGGWGNGYVILPEGHKYHGVHYDSILVDVHYGLTFSELVTDTLIDKWPELTEADKGGWIVGFDTLHYGDTSEKWPKEAVQAEADNLMSQLNENQ